MDKFNALLNTFDETEQKKENERLEKEAKEREKQNLETAFEDERKCGLIDLTEEFFYGFADFLGIREKIGTDLILEQKGDLSNSQYAELFTDTKFASQTSSFNKFLITLNIKDKSFYYTLFIEQNIRANDFYYALYFKEINTDHINMFSQASRSPSMWFDFRSGRMPLNYDTCGAKTVEEKLKYGFAFLSSAKAEQFYQRKNEEWKPIFERIFADFQKMIQEA